MLASKSAGGKYSINNCREVIIPTKGWYVLQWCMAYCARSTERLTKVMVIRTKLGRPTDISAATLSYKITDFTIFKYYYII